MTIIEKDPSESFGIGMDFAPAMPVGTSISQASASVVDEADGSVVTGSLLASTAATVDGPVAKVKVRNGVDGHIYRVLFTVILDDGTIIRDGFRLSVKAL